MSDRANSAEATISQSRLMVGGGVFVVGQLAPLTIPLVANSPLPAAWKTALSGLLLLGVPEIAIVLAVVILGKAGFDALKSKLFGSLKETLLPGEVSRRRYYFGLVLFLIPVFFGWAAPYFQELLPGLTQRRLAFAIVGDVTLIVALCTMGGQFWDKLRALFRYEARVIFTSAEPTRQE